MIVDWLDEITADSGAVSAFTENVANCILMSALPPKADMCSAPAHVCFGPEADISPSFDNFGDLLKVHWHGQAERFCTLKIDDKLEFCRPLHHSFAP
jgi:hypothetical protein